MAGAVLTRQLTDRATAAIPDCGWWLDDERRPVYSGRRQEVLWGRRFLAV